MNQCFTSLLHRTTRVKRPEYSFKKREYSFKNIVSDVLNIVSKVPNLVSRNIVSRRLNIVSRSLPPPKSSRFSYLIVLNIFSDGLTDLSDASWLDAIRPFAKLLLEQMPSPASFESLLLSV